MTLNLHAPYIDERKEEQRRNQRLARHFENITYYTDKRLAMEFFKALPRRTQRYIRSTPIYAIALKCARFRG